MDGVALPLPRSCPSPHVIAVPGAAGRAPAARGHRGVSPTRVLDTRSRPRSAARRGRSGDRRWCCRCPAAKAAGATSVVLNLTATQAGGPGWVKAWPCGTSRAGDLVAQLRPGPHRCEPGRRRAAGAGRRVLWPRTRRCTWSPTCRAGSPGATTSSGPPEPDPRHPGDRRPARRRAGAPAAGRRHGEHPGAAGVRRAEPHRRRAAGRPVGSSPTRAVRRPSSSSVNFNAGEIVANLTLVATHGGDVCLRSWGTTEVVVDTYGWSAGGGDLRVQSPQRLLDTRDPARGRTARPRTAPRWRCASPVVAASPTTPPRRS